MGNEEIRPGRQCPKGHTMDPNWEGECPYCEAEKRSRKKTDRADFRVSADDRKTRVGVVNPKPEGRVTKTIPAGGGHAKAGGHIGAGDTRQVVGVLATYTWLPQGALFPIREGKNFIGSDKVSSDASHQDCDVQISQDRRMSGEHALILCRQGIYEIIDQTSSNGTFLNGVMLSANQSQQLKNYSEIKAGSTVFTFIKIEPPVGSEKHPDISPGENGKEGFDLPVDNNKNTFVK